MSKHSDVLGGPARGWLNRRRWAMATAGALIVVATGTVLPASASAAPAQSPTCPQVYFIGVRGSGEKKSDTSGETLGMGTRVARVYTEWKATLPADTRSRTKAEFIEYPAEPVTLLAPTAAQVAGLLLPTPAGLPISPAKLNALKGYSERVQKWSASAKEGSQKLAKKVRDLYADCRTSKFVLAGYSQGAMAAHQALDDLIEDFAYDSIIGVFLVADGDRYLTQANRFGSAGSTTGVRAYVGTALPTFTPRPAATVKANVVADICNSRDIVCAFNPVTALTGIGVHTSYQAKGNNAIPDAVKGMASQINSGLRYPVIRLNAHFPQAIMNKVYTSTLLASGGDGRYTFKVTGLPTGLKQRGNVINGTPKQFGKWDVSVTVTDGSGQKDRYHTTLVVGLQK